MNRTLAATAVVLCFALLGAGYVVLTAPDETRTEIVKKKGGKKGAKKAKGPKKVRRGYLAEQQRDGLRPFFVEPGR